MTGQVWKRRGTFDWEGLWVLIAILVGLMLVLNLVVAYFTPKKVCLEWREIDTMEIVATFGQRIPVLKKEKVCAKLVDE